MSEKEEDFLDEELEIDWDDEEDDEGEESKEVVLSETNDGVKLPEAWGQTATNMDEVSKHRQSFNLKHGMFANVPMICKGTECPLHELCTIPIRNRPVFKRCPIEIAAIIEQFDKYCTELDIGENEHFDRSMLKDLVDVEIKLLRANGHLAISGDFIEQVVTAIDDKGNPHTRPELHKATEYEETLLERKRKILNELKATRKSKNDDDVSNEVSSFASELMRRAQQSGYTPDIVDIDYSELEDDEEESSDQYPESVNSDIESEGDVE